MSRFTIKVALAGAALSGVVLFGVDGAAAQTAPSGQFGQRTSSGTYLPSTSDLGCAGILCNPLPSSSPSGGIARSPSEVAPPPPCQGLLCSLTPYSMQRPYTAAQAAEAERQRAAAQAAAPYAPAPAPTRHARKRRAKAVRAAARTPAPAEAAQ